MRITCLAPLLVVATIFPGAAHARFEPRLYVSHAPMSLGSAATTSIRLVNPAETEALASVRFVIPRAYEVTLPAATPSEWPAVGRATAVAYNGGLSSGDVLNGRVYSVPSWSLDWQSTNCSGSATHAAAFSVIFPTLGWRARIGMFFDAATSAGSPSASYTAELCLPQVADGFTPILTELELDLRGVFSTPRNAGDYVWSAVASPWSGIPFLEPDIIGHAPPNSARAVDLGARVRLPSGIELSTKTRHRAIVVVGRVYEGLGAPESALVHLSVGRHKRTLWAGKRGVFRSVFKLGRGHYIVRAEAIVGERTTARRCRSGGLVELCGSETLPAWTTARTINVRVNR